MTDSYVPPSNPISRAGAGVVGGIVAGVVLGIALSVFGHMRPFAGLVGKSSLQVAWTVLLVVCAVLGVVFALIAGRSVAAQLVPAIGVGIFYGGACWLVLHMLVVPLVNSDDVFSFGGDSLQVLGAYVAFGVVLGVVYALTGPKRRYYQTRWRNPYQMSWSMPRPRRRRKRRRDD